MSAKPTPITPNALSIAEALRASAPLASLRDALRESNARFQAIKPALPGALAAHVKPGPVDAEGWSLLAANGSVAAKLRQLTPRFEILLREAGWNMTAVRIKIASAGPVR
jgi:hypothetical protein